MVAATGIRILSNVDYKTNRNNLFIVAISIGIGMIPLIAPNFKQWMPHSIHPLIESGILLSSICAVALNLDFNCVSDDGSDGNEAPTQSDSRGGSARSRPGSPPRRLVLPGITGSLIYPASADAARCRLEAALLYWGQWLGLGQKTTLGCGRFTWTPLP